MLALRIYISALTLTFLILVVTNHGLGFLQGVVITCALLFLILDVRTDLQSREIEFRLLQDLEQRISELRREIP
jgi:multisubunit Na+/H+ antiporter MnhB subunit